jgi:hypothetical protein
MLKQAPDIVMRQWLNQRTGQTSSIPTGIDPGFDYNSGIATEQIKAMEQLQRDKTAALSPAIAQAATAAGLKAPKIAKAVADQPNWKTLGLADLRLAKEKGETPALLQESATAEEALVTLRNALGLEKGGSVLIPTPVESVRIHDSSLLHVVEKRLDTRERFANFIKPTLETPTEVWETAYDDATVRRRYIKVFAGARYDLLVIVRVEPDGSIFWNMMQRERKGMNALRQGKLLYEEK